MKLAIRNPTPSLVIAWKVLSFLASDPEVQLPLVGRADQWFCKERVAENEGANYLIGVGLIYLQYSGALFDAMDPDVEVVVEVSDRFREMLKDKKSSIWSVQGLRAGAEWSDLRRLSAEILRICGWSVNLPKAPFEINQLIEVEGYM